MINHYPIMIKGGYGLYNFGDDALMVAVYAIARKAFAVNEIAFLCWDAPYIKKWFPDANIIPINSSDKKAHTDLLLYGGGTQFYSFPLSRIRTLKVANAQSLLPYIFRPVEFVKKGYRTLNRKKELITRDLIPHNRSAALGIGLGPFESSSIEELRTQRLLKKMEFIAVRDPVSARTCRSWGINNFIQGADLCFLPDLWEIEQLRKNAHRLSSSFKKIGVIVRDWKHSTEGMAYNKKLFQLINALRKKNRKAKFILFRKDDIEWRKRLEAHGEDVIAWEPDSNSIDEFLEILSGFDAFITARYHGAIFASLLSKPSLCIGIEPKLEIIAEQLKSFSAVWRYPYDIESGLRKIQQLENTIQSSNAVIGSEIQRAVRMAQYCITYLKRGE